MASSSQGSKVLLQSSTCLRQRAWIQPNRPYIRLISQSSTKQEEAVTTASTTPAWLKNLPPDFDLRYAHDQKQSRHLWKTQGRAPIGSRRLRQAKASNAGIPFEQLPYQCFQEARKVLAENRKETVVKLEVMKARMQRLLAKPAETSEERLSKSSSLPLLQKQVDGLKVEADIRDPQVKRRFEDGLGDMNKPIYRHLADQKWREYKRPLVMQRITQMHVVPDVLDQIDPLASVELSFPGVKVQPGEFVESLRSQYPPNLNVQVYDAGPRLVTVVVVDSDVPDFENDRFVARCHGIYTNIEITPTKGNIFLEQYEVKPEHTLLPWMPPYAFKGSPYHRLSVFVLQHKNNEKWDVEKMRNLVQRDEFSTRQLVGRSGAKVTGVTMFRTQWDEGMLSLLKKYNIEGSEIQMRRKAPDKLPYKKRDTRRLR